MIVDRINFRQIDNKIDRLKSVMNIIGFYWILLH